MKVRTKLIIGFSAVVVLLWLIVFYAANNMGGLKEHFLAVESDIIPNTLEINEIENTADDAYQLTMDYVLRDLPEADESSRIQIYKLVQLGQTYLPQAEQISPIEYSDNQKLLVKIDSLTFNLSNIINLKEIGTSYSELLAFDRNFSLPALLDLEQFISEKKADSIVQLSAIGEDYKQAHFSGILWLFVSAGFITIIGIAAAYLTTRSIVRPLHALHKGTDMISQGRLDYKVGTKAKDEIGQLSRAFDQMTTNLDKSMTSIDVLNAEITERKKVEEALRKSEERYRDLFNNASELIQSADRQGKLIYANKAWQESLGYDESEIENLTFMDIIHPDYLAHCEETVQQLLSGEEIPRIETTFISKDGNSIQVEGDVSAQYENGEVVGTRGIFHDVTERQKREHLQQDENYILTLLGQGTELGELLDAIVHLGEDHDPSILGSILVYDPVKQWLNQASGPSLPEEYLQLMEGGIPIGPVMGSCGTAAYRKERVVIPDIANDPLFESAEEVVNVTTKNNMLACWSQPILSSNGELLGTIANYSNKVGNPDPDDIRILEWSARISTIAIERKQAEEALQESEDKFSKAFRSSPNTIVITTIKDGRFIEVNDSFTDITGYTREEVVGNTVKDINIWAQTKDRDKMLRILKKDGKVHNHEFNFRIKSGEIRTWLFSAELLNIGNEPCMISMTIDITDLKRAEESIKDSEDKFSKAFHSSPAAISISLVNDGSFIEVNNSYTRITGYSRKELICHTAEEYNMWADTKQKDEMIHKIENREKMNNEEYAFRIKSGEIRTMLVSNEYLNLNGKVCVLVSSTDITGRKQAAEALRMSEERFRLIADNATDLISRIQMTPDIKTDYMSPSCLRITGYKQEEFYSDPNLGLEMIHPEDREFFVKHVSSDNKKDQKPITVRLVRKDGQVIWIEQTHAAISNDQGEIIAMHLIAREITERKDAEEQLKHAIANLEQSSAQLEATNKELETFSYSVSHDLRSPLRSIDGFSQALLEDYAGSLDDTGKDYLNRLRSASQKMGELIDGLLKLSRLMRSEMHQEEVDLSTLVEEITSRLHENDPKRQAEFVIRKGLVTQGDPELLRALFENLLGNAWKFTSKSKKTRIEFGTTKNGNKTTYFINDNGAGFDMTYADKLFGAFQRLHETSEFPGTGIGLATVLRIINRHGGNIWAEGAVNKGATFYFTLN